MKKCCGPHCNRMEGSPLLERHYSPREVPDPQLLSCGGKPQQPKGGAPTQPKIPGWGTPPQLSPLQDLQSLAPVPEGDTDGSAPLLWRLRILSHSSPVSTPHLPLFPLNPLNSACSPIHPDLARQNAGSPGGQDRRYRSASS